MVTDNPQKSLYPSGDVAEWIEQTADESNRSESYVLKKIVQGVKESVDGEPISVDEHGFKAE